MYTPATACVDYFMFTKKKGKSKSITTKCHLFQARQSTCSLDIEK